MMAKRLAIHFKLRKEGFKTTPLFLSYDKGVNPTQKGEKSIY